MGNKLISHCPVCSENLTVTKLKCNKCETEITGEFTLSKFNYLSKEQLEFAEVFIKNRGNIKEIEKELGISYPTVRRAIDNIVEALGYQTKSEMPKVDKKAILEMLEKGEIDSSKAIKMLQGEEEEE